MRIAELAVVRPTPSMRATCDALDPSAPADYRELAALLADRWSAAPRPRRVGLGGGQGAGKSTLGRLLAAACERVDLRCCVLGLDDFYLTKDERAELAERVHPILATRGPPGTHDVTALRAAMDALLDAGEVEVPVFDKGIDDRAGVRTLRGPFDLLVVEGWCIGARPVDEAELVAPINALEREDDPDGSWRRYVNERLRLDFEPLLRELDRLVFLEVPNLDAVRRWRLEQENERAPEQRMSAAQVARFVEHYERVSLAMLRDLAPRADVRVELDENHGVSGVRLGERASAST